jgi:hypothetical protein
MTFTTLSDEQERESRLYWKEALRCEEAKAFLAGSVMLGSALETLLLLMVNVYPEEAERTGCVPMRKGVARPLMQWKLADLLKVAKAANWLPSGLNSKDETGEKRKWATDAEVVRMVRNLVHPARYAEDHYRSRVTAKYLQRQFDVVLLCRDWLVERNNKSL